MFKRAVVQPTLLIVTIVLATACTAKSPDAATEITPPAAPSTAAAVASTATAAAPAAAASVASTAAPAAASVIAPPQGMPAGPEPKEGTDYNTIDTPDQPTGNQVQVTEVFGYGCIHCSDLQPELSKWKKTLPSDVQFNYLPGPFGGLPDGFMRAFYAAQAMGVQEKSHDGIFKAVHVDKRVATVDDIPKLYADYGVDPKTFASTMQSFAVTAKVAAATDQAQRWAIQGTPTIVVDGKYRVLESKDGGSVAMFHTVEWLVAKQRPEHAKH